jgi:signal transduction histidine kinase
MKPVGLMPRAWPLTVRVPLLVAVLMVIVGALASELVLLRLERTQEGHLRALTSAYLDGIATAVTPHLVRKDPWEAFDVLDRSRERYEALDVVHAVVILPDGNVLAATDPRDFPTLTPVPASLLESPAFEQELHIEDDRGRAFVGRRLRSGGGDIGSILAEIDIGALLAERREVLTTLILLNAVVTLFLAVVGYFAVRRMLAPVAVLTRHVESVRAGSPAPIPTDRLHDPRTEFGRLFQRFNAMAAAVAEREALAVRLADEEKLAQLGRLASGMAHEVNNPLGGMQTAVATLRKHGADPQVRDTSLSLLERGLTGIRNVVRAALVTYKGGEEPSWLAPADLDDLQFLIQHEVGRRRLEIEWANRLPSGVPVDGGAIRQAVLNLLLNACAASPVGGRVRFEASMSDGALRFLISDEGPGLPEPLADLLARPDQNALPEGAEGLGIWTSARLIARLGGTARADRRQEGGTHIAISIPLSEGVRLDDVA